MGRELLVSALAFYMAGIAAHRGNMYTVTDELIIILAGSSVLPVTYHLTSL
jgi:hypothetical protein